MDPLDSFKVDLQLRGPLFHRALTVQKDDTREHSVLMTPPPCRLLYGETWPESVPTKREINGQDDSEDDNNPQDNK